MGAKCTLRILLAFLILILSSTVVYILWGKFEEEIALLQGAAQDSYELPRAPTICYELLRIPTNPYEVLGQSGSLWCQR